MTLTEWIDYGEFLAATHSEINHQDVQGKRAFAVVDVEEAFGDLKSLEGNIVLRWIIPTWTKVDEGGNPRDVYNAGLLVLVKHRRGITNSYIDAILKAKQIADDIIVRISYESRNNVGLFAGGADIFDDIRATGTPIKSDGDASYSGWLVTLSVWDFANDCVVVDGISVWTDM